MNASEYGGLGAGWLGLAFGDVCARIRAFALEHPAWRRELTDAPERLAEEALTLLTSLNLVKTDTLSATHWFSPAIHRWNLKQSLPRDKHAAAQTDASLLENGTGP